MDANQALQSVPSWLLRPERVGWRVDEALHDEIARLMTDTPEQLWRVNYALQQVQDRQEYDAAANLASALIWSRRSEYFNSPDPNVRAALASIAAAHMTRRGASRLLRALSLDANSSVRSAAETHAAYAELMEVRLPGSADESWEAAGWPLTKRSGAEDDQPRPAPRRPAALPELATIGQLRSFLGVRSAKQFGFFLLAAEEPNGPYTRFVIEKRGGGERSIHAPQDGLKAVQRRILDEILSPMPVHPAAHGFVVGRSTVTNAGPHCRAALVLKFDLVDFFPTIRFARVTGLFRSLGYSVGNGRFSNRTDDQNVAPTLARLCCVTESPENWLRGVLPQGAPTSPAISNLVCRRMDRRLTGLAQSQGGSYTRYADDLTFSFPDRALSIGRFRWWVDQICHQEGFRVNHDKFRAIRNSQRQQVTGIVVNDRPRLPRRTRRRFRAILHNCERRGLQAESRGNPAFASWLQGFASYAAMVDPQEGRQWLERVRALIESD